MVLPLPSVLLFFYGLSGESGPNAGSGTMEDFDFLGANLIESDLGLLQMRGAKLVRARLYGADLTLTNLIEADLRQAKLGMTKPHWTILDRASLSEASL
jgi:uncharacterized protein YjbI with pentapeptide repeats